MGSPGRVRAARGRLQSHSSQDTRGRAVPAAGCCQPSAKHPTTAKAALEPTRPEGLSASCDPPPPAVTPRPRLRPVPAPRSLPCPPLTQKWSLNLASRMLLPLLLLLPPPPPQLPEPLPVPVPVPPRPAPSRPAGATPRRGVPTPRRCSQPLDKTRGYIQPTQSSAVSSWVPGAWDAGGAAAEDTSARGAGMTSAGTVGGTR